MNYFDSNDEIAFTQELHKFRVTGTAEYRAQLEFAEFGITLTVEVTATVPFSLLVLATDEQEATTLVDSEGDGDNLERWLDWSEAEYEVESNDYCLDDEDALASEIQSEGEFHSHDVNDTSREG
jgi:hypothetical protein